jgi:cation diffusion facilitator family transporter
VSAAGRAAADLAGARARRRSARLSVVAACFLVALKLGTALATGSLAFLAEAAHSATDLVAALLTLFAVRVATRPPDQEHNYGHGKAEHLAALGESAVLLLFALAIGAESIMRLAEDDGHGVEATWWSFLVLAVVITIDVARMLASSRAARRHGSPALAANALHFGSDLAGSIAVLVGTILVAAGSPRADAAAALLVAVLVIGLALRLAWQSVGVLMDRTSGETEGTIRAALARLREPVELRRVRVRHAAGRHFADLVVGVAPDKAVGQAHATADAIEDLVAEALGNADVVVHVEPAASSAHGGLRERATAAALTVPEVREVHNVRVMRVGDGHELSLHVKLPRELSLAEAHDVIERLEEGIHAAVPELGNVHTHIEPLARTDWAYTPAAAETAQEREAVEEAVRGITGAPPAEIRFRDAERGRVALVTITLPGEQPLPSAHHRAGRIEEAVRERCPAIADVIVHTEPEGGAPPAPRPSAEVDRGGQRDREQHAEVPEVARDEQDHGDHDADRDRGEPGDAGGVHGRQG